MGKEDRSEFAGDMDTAVRIAIDQHKEWQEKATPSAAKKELVPVRDGDAFVMRRPFKKRGSWHVRWSGLPRLVYPHYSNGALSFEADWS